MVRVLAVSEVVRGVSSTDSDDYFTANSFGNITLKQSQ